MSCRIRLKTRTRNQGPWKMFPVYRCFVQVLAHTQLTVMIDPSLKRLPPWRYVRHNFSQPPQAQHSSLRERAYTCIIAYGDNRWRTD